MALVDRHREITAPTLVLWGGHDPWQTIGDGERLAAEIPGAELVRVEASHWIPQDAPEAFAASILRFLTVTQPDAAARRAARILPCIPSVPSVERERSVSIRCRGAIRGSMLSGSGLI